MKESRKFKIVHLFFVRNEGFNLGLVQAICNPANGFNTEEHLFVTPCKSLYDKVKDRCHIEYRDARNTFQLIRLVNEYGDRGEWIFAHSFPGDACNVVQLIPKRYLHKIIWRTWGHDCVRSRAISFLVRKRGIRRLHELYAVGVANVVDEAVLKRDFNLKDFRFLPYLPPEGGGTAEQPDKDINLQEDCCHVMVGHSGFAVDRHVEVLGTLKRFADKPIRIHVMLPYGDPEYVKTVKDYISANDLDACCDIFEETVGFGAFCLFVSRMNAVILDTLISNGLGTLALALVYKKKLFVNRKGVLKEGLTAEHIPFHCTDELNNMSYEELCKEKPYEIPPNSTLLGASYEGTVEIWKKMFNELIYSG